LDFKPTEKHEKNVVVRKRASKRQPGITLGCCGGILAILVIYNPPLVLIIINPLCLPFVLLITGEREPTL
jgi:hypothetical protein